MRLTMITGALLVTGLLAAAGASAQSVEIYGNNSHAKNCYDAARAAAQLRFTSGQDLEECNEAIEFGVLKKRDRAGTLVNRAIIHTNLSHFQEAYEDYERAMEMMPELPEPYVGRGNIFFIAGELQRALDDYTKSLELGLTREHIAYLNRGMVYEKLGRYDIAEENYLKALESLPDWRLAQEKLSMVRGKQAVNTLSTPAD